ncbi:MAG: flagellar hook-basal body complex protein FliE [Spirochaetaceae bacterium]|jgi:flagellar hook-basal body complex protein FliE|nr:flagellar hook-basal body complex protein FliE [Spirochaetaceae bacterium]
MTGIEPLEMKAARPGHIGFQKTAPQAVTGPEAPRRGDFGSRLAEALEYVNQKQNAASSIKRQSIIDPDSVDIGDVMTAIAESTMSLEAANRIINQMITSWNEITTTR